MTADDVRTHLQRACDRAGGLRAWGRKHKVSANYVSRILSREIDPGPKVCKPLGIEQVTTYRWVKK